MCRNQRIILDMNVCDFGGRGWSTSPPPPQPLPVIAVGVGDVHYNRLFDYCHYTGAGGYSEARDGSKKHRYQWQPNVRYSLAVTVAPGTTRGLSLQSPFLRYGGGFLLRFVVSPQTRWWRTHRTMRWRTWNVDPTFAGLDWATWHFLRAPLFGCSEIWKKFHRMFLRRGPPPYWRWPRGPVE